MSEKSKRILIFTSAFRPLIGGSEIAIENVARHLPNVFFDVVTPRYKKSFKSLEDFANLKVYRLGVGSHWDKYLFPILGFIKGLRLLRKNHIQLVQAYQASYGAGAAWLIKFFRPKIKLIITLQEGKNLNNQNGIIRFLRKLILKKANIITTISNYLADYAVSINSRAKIMVIPNGVDTNIFRPKNEIAEEDQLILAEKLGLKSDNRVIISVSRLVEKNGLTDLIASLVYVKETTPLIKLIIIGQGPLEKELKQQIKKLNLSNEVLFLGQIENKQLPAYLKLGDIFVRPSYSEGLGNSFLEAMAVGLPIIGTPVGGIPDFLEDRQTGIFCKPHDPLDLNQKIIEILSDGDLRKKIIENGRQLITQKYNWDLIAKKFENLYSNGI